MSDDEVAVEAEVEAETAAEVEKAERKPMQQDELSAEEKFEAAQPELAAKDGWKPLEDWVESGKEPEDWVPASIFNVRKGLVGEIRRLKRKEASVDERFVNLNKIHEASMEVQKTQLTEELNAAVLEGGEANLEIAKNRQHSIDAINQAKVVSAPVQTADGALLDEWNTNNQWILGTDSKANHGKALWAEAGAKGMDTQQALSYLEAGMAKEFPTQRTTSTVSDSEKGSKPTGFRKHTAKITMDDLSEDERASIKALPSVFGAMSEKELLQAVQDSRKD